MEFGEKNEGNKCTAILNFQKCATIIRKKLDHLKSLRYKNVSQSSSCSHSLVKHSRQKVSKGVAILWFQNGKNALLILPILKVLIE